MVLVLAGSAVFSVRRNEALAAMRSNFLTLDYGRAMLRSMPTESFLFMDGGDDAFYSLAMLRYVEGKRSDTVLHDRGGLVFRNPYGDDFRSLPKDLKQQRRRDVEMAAFRQAPVFYSTMDNNVLPGVPMVQTGFLLRTAGEGTKMDWPLILLRSLYPLQPDNYRMRALGVFFPYMRGRELLRAGSAGKAYPYLRRAQAMGSDVDWLKVNLGSEYALAAYQSLISGDYAHAELLYRDWIRFDPSNMQAYSNLGVVFERTGRIDEAKAQYEAAVKLSPQAVDPLFNLAVLAWKEKNWPAVIRDLEEVLRRKPDHAEAAAYLQRARLKVRS